MPINTPYSFSLDIVKQTKIPYMQFYQTDVNTSQMAIEITNNDEVVDLTGHTVLVNINKADGTKIQNVVTIEDASKGLLNLSLTTQSLTAIGECRVQLTIFDGTNRKSVHEIKYYVLPSMLDLTVPESVNEYGWLLQLIGQVQSVENILNTSEAERVEAENNRVILYGQLSTLKTELETLQGQLNSLETNVEESEYAREYNEQQRQILKGQLDTLQAELLLLQTELNDLNSTVNSNEETRQSNEIQRQANELDRIELKGQLDSLKGSLQSLENTLNTNDATRTNTVNNKMYEVDNKVVNYEAIITDIQNRFALLSTSVQQASEVINARTSTLRNRTFADLNSRIAEAEKDILTQQNTQVTDNISYMNVLANSLDGATDVTIKGNTLVNLYPDNVEKVLPIPLSLVDRVDSVFHLANTLEGNSEFNLKGQSLVQLVKNGNFASGTSGWLGVQSTITSSPNTLLITSDGTSSSPFAYQVTTTPITTGRKVFVRAKLKVTNSNATSIKIQITGSTTSGTPYEIIQNAPTINTLYTLQGICTIPSDMVGFVRIRLYHTYVDTATANGKVMEVQEVMALDLTSLSLDTLTADQINAMLPTYFEGISQYEGATYKSIGENLLNETDYLANTYIGLPVGSEGEFATNTNSRTSKKIKCKPNTQYTVSGGNRSIWRFEDDKGNKVGYSISSTVTTPSNASYMYVYYSLDGTHANVMLNLGATPKTYSAYRSAQATITDTLRSVGTVADEYIGNKKITRVGRVVLNGSEANWLLGMTLTNVMCFDRTLTPSNAKDYGKTLSDKFRTDLLGNEDEEHLRLSSGSAIRVFINKSKLPTQDVNGFKTWLSTNNIEVLYELATPTETTITPLTLPIYPNGTLIVEPTKLFPKLSSQDTYDKTINLKPSTLYSIFVNAKTVGTLEVDCGGNKANITPIATYTNNKVTITTPTTLTHSMLKLKGGNISTKDYMVIETDVVEPKYFSGISSVDDVVVKSIGENLFDKSKVINGYRFSGGATDGTTIDALFCITDYVRLKPSTTYFVNDKGASVVCFYDINKILTRVISLNNASFTPNANENYIRMTVSLTKLDLVVLNTGTTAKAYTQYKEDKITLSEYLLPEHFPLRSVGGVSDEYVGKKLFKRIDKARFIPTNLTTSNTNVDIVRMSKTSVMKGYNVASSDWAILGNLVELKVGSGFDNIANTGKYSTAISSAWIDILVAKGTFATLQQAIDYYNANVLDIIYQLATPTEITLDRPLNIQVYKNGCIVTEPTKLLPRLTYNFPTNINSGLVGIQKSLQNIKDNQNFVMAYMLDLETRLSLIEGGL